MSLPLSKPQSRTVFVNGAYLPEEAARVSIFDRGYVFGDGVYEVATVLDGKLVDSPRHKWRLEKSLAALDIPMPMPWEDIEDMERELIRRNALDQGLVYFQVTRGAADRKFSYTPGALTPTISAFTQVSALDPDPRAETGVTVVTCPDLRWKRRDIKSIALLAQVLAKQIAAEAGAHEALMIEDGYITEGASSSAFIIDAQNHLIVRPGGGPDILPGLTRLALLDLAQDCNLTIIERPFTLDELLSAQEAFLTSASTFVMPITHVNTHPIAAGTPGPLTRHLRQLLIDTARANLT